MTIIVIDDISGSTIDLTPYLYQVSEDINQNSSVMLSQERERKAFQRVMGDCRFIVSNIDEAVATFFSSLTADRNYKILITHEGDTLYVGFIEKDRLRYDPKLEVWKFDSFNVNKQFWDRAKETKLQRSLSSTLRTSAYVSLTTILKLNLIDRDSFKDLFSQLSIDSLYANRNIRAGLSASSYSDNSITNLGRYTELSPETSVSELLEAMAIFYNAEFYVNEAGSLVMGRRNSVLRDRQVNIDAILLDDEEIDIQMFDDEKIDYLYAPFYVQPPPALEISLLANNFVSGSVGKSKNLSYVMTAVLGTNNGYETAGSLPLTIDVQSRVDNVNTKSVLVDLSIPAVPYQDVIKRRIYSTLEGGSEFFLAVEIGGNSRITWQDRLYTGSDKTTTQLDTSKKPPSESTTTNAWISYSESKGQWNVPLLDVRGRDNSPQGRIFNVTPKLQFTEMIRPGNVLPFDPFAVWCFFGREGHIVSNGLELLQQQYLDMFRTKRKARCSVSGIDIKIGDSVVSNGGIFPNDLTVDRRYVVKKATVNLLRETSKLELISV